MRAYMEGGPAHARVLRLAISVDGLTFVEGDGTVHMYRQRVRYSKTAAAYAYAGVNDDNGDCHG